MTSRYKSKKSFVPDFHHGLLAPMVEFASCLITLIHQMGCSNRWTDPTLPAGLLGKLCKSNPNTFAMSSSMSAERSANSFSGPRAPCSCGMAAIAWPPQGKKQKYHRYPKSIRDLAKKSGVNLDTRPNGPAIAAFQIAGGVRPERFGSSNAWSIHHVYSGKFPYVRRTTTTHAIKDRKHFTQSAGLIATHPVADALSDEYPFFAWLLRVESFRRFAYDPDGGFSTAQDEFGFGKGNSCEVLVNGASEVVTK